MESVLIIILFIGQWIVQYFIFKAAVRNGIIEAKKSLEDDNNGKKGGIEQKKCEECHQEYDVDSPKCPYCHAPNNYLKL